MLESSRIQRAVLIISVSGTSCPWTMSGCVFMQWSSPSSILAHVPQPLAMVLWHRRQSQFYMMQLADQTSSQPLSGLTALGRYTLSAYWSGNKNIFVWCFVWLDLFCLSFVQVLHHPILETTLPVVHLETLLLCWTFCWVRLATERLSWKREIKWECKPLSKQTADNQTVKLPTMRTHPLRLLFQRYWHSPLLVQALKRWWWCSLAALRLACLLVCEFSFVLGEARQIGQTRPAFSDSFSILKTIVGVYRLPKSPQTD